ncbi:IS3 family transposase [Rubrobacter xylanophilus]|uniref:IS3 family transposase n=1 Tax=Rubrobacter xylanophilus TaxID=49319 RepID=UPI00398B41E1
MGVSRSWYYERPSATEKAKKDVELRDAIERIVLEFPGYGYPRVSAALEREGWSVNHKRVLRIMREESLLCQPKRRFVPTTDSAHSLKRYPNLIKRCPHRRTRPGLDRGHHLRQVAHHLLLPGRCVGRLLPQRCVGWHLSRFIDTGLRLSALEMALASRRPAVGLIHHSDQGVQYASSEYILRLEEAGIRISMAAELAIPTRTPRGRELLQNAEARGGLHKRLPRFRGGPGKHRPVVHRGALQRRFTPPTNYQTLSDLLQPALRPLPEKREGAVFGLDGDAHRGSPPGRSRT